VKDERVNFYVSVGLFFLLVKKIYPATLLNEPGAKGTLFREEPERLL
jgi:hypothetical protein